MDYQTTYLQNKKNYSDLKQLEYGGGITSPKRVNRWASPGITLSSTRKTKNEQENAKLMEIEQQLLKAHSETQAEIDAINLAEKTSNISRTSRMANRAQRIAEIKDYTNERNKNAQEIANLAELKIKYGSTQYYYPMNELKKQIIMFIDELICCEEENNIGYGSTIPAEQKQFHEIIKKNYTIMADAIRKNNLNSRKMSEIYNYVPIEKIQSYFETNYKQIIDSIFDAYETFIQNYTFDVKMKKIPFYVVVPITRNTNNSMKNENSIMPDSCNSNKLVKVGQNLSGSSIENCYLMLGTQGLTRILLPLEELYKTVTSSSNYPSELQTYIKNIVQILQQKIAIINYIKKEQELHNYEIASICSYNKAKYGDKKIYDNRSCPKTIKNAKDCVLPCTYDKKSNGCEIKY
jgi:hypothetical protein